MRFRRHDISYDLGSETVLGAKIMVATKTRRSLLTRTPRSRERRPIFPVCFFSFSALPYSPGPSAH